MPLPHPTPRALGRAYFGVQAIAGGAWWALVFTTPAVREATLGALPSAPVAAADVPLFVLGSALAALGIRWAVWVVTAWTGLVAAAMVIYATVTQLAGLGAVLMLAAAAASAAAAALMLLGRMPGELLTVGPLSFALAPVASTRAHLARTGWQIAAFWSTFLVLIPVVIALLEVRWQLRLETPIGVQVLGGAVLIAASALGLWSAHALASRGEGTPLPSVMPRRLVVDGPYRFVRNPMAIAGIAQGVGVGLAMGSWMVAAWAAAGSLVWNWIVRPQEEADMEARFGDEYRVYRDAVRCWVPQLLPYTPPPSHGGGSGVASRAEGNAHG